MNYLEISPGCSSEGLMLKLKLQEFGHLMLIGKDPDAGKDCRQEKGMTEDEMAGWHHWLDGHEFEWTLGVGDGQGGLACCDSWGRKESDTTEWLTHTWYINYFWWLVFVLLRNAYWNIHWIMRNTIGITFMWVNTFSII